mgnify:CR=1 FL=1
MLYYNQYSVGDSLRELRKNKNMTQYEMADKLDISYTHYAQIEQGKHKMSVDLLLKMMFVLSADANTILGVENETKNDSSFEIVTGDKELLDFIKTVSSFDRDKRNFIEITLR